MLLWNLHQELNQLTRVLVLVFLRNFKNSKACTINHTKPYWTLTYGSYFHSRKISKRKTSRDFNFAVIKQWEFYSFVVTHFGYVARDIKVLKSNLILKRTQKQNLFIVFSQLPSYLKAQNCFLFLIRSVLKVNT